MINVDEFLNIFQKVFNHFIQKMKNFSRIECFNLKSIDYNYINNLISYFENLNYDFVKEFSEICLNYDEEKTQMFKNNEFILLNKIKEFLDWSKWIHIITQIPFQFLQNVQYCGALIISPFQSTNSINRFQSLTQLTVPFHCVIFNSKDCHSQFNILTKFPNNSYFLYSPLEYEIKKQEKNLNIISELRLSCFSWSEIGTVTFAPTFKIDSGLFKFFSKKLIDFFFEIHSNYNQIFLLCNGFVELCDSVQIKIHPYL